MPVAGQEDNIGEGATDVHADPVIHHIDHVLNGLFGRELAGDRAPTVGHVTLGWATCPPDL